MEASSLASITNFLIIGSIAILVASLAKKDAKKNSKSKFSAFLDIGLMILFWSAIYYVLTAIKESGQLKPFLNPLSYILVGLTHITHIVFLFLVVLLGIASLYIFLKDITKKRFEIIVHVGIAVLIVGIIKIISWALLGLIFLGFIGIVLFLVYFDKDSYRKKIIVLLPLFLGILWLIFIGFPTLGNPEGTLTIPELLEMYQYPTYYQEVTLYGKATLFNQSSTNCSNLIPCFSLTSDKKTMVIWYNSTINFNNGDWVNVTGEPKIEGDYRSITDFWASDIVLLNKTRNFFFDTQNIVCIKGLNPFLCKPMALCTNSEYCLNQSKQ